MGRNRRGHWKQWDKLRESHMKLVLPLRAFSCSHYMADKSHTESDSLIWWERREEFRATEDMKNWREKTPRKETQAGGAPNSAYKFHSNLVFLLIWICTEQEWKPSSNWKDWKSWEAGRAEQGFSTAAQCSESSSQAMFNGIGQLLRFTLKILVGQCHQSKNVSKTKGLL